MMSFCLSGISRLPRLHAVIVVVRVCVTSVIVQAK